MDYHQTYYHFTYISKDNIYLRSSSYLEDPVGEWGKTLDYIKNNLSLNNEQIDNSFPGENGVFKESSDFWFIIEEINKKFKKGGFVNHLREKKQKRKWLQGLIIVLLLVIAFSYCLEFYWEYSSKKNYLSELHEANEEIMPLVLEKEKSEIKYNQLSKEIDLLATYLNNNYGYLPWLNEISNKISTKTVIDEIRFQNEKLVLLKGRTPSATLLMKTLKNSPLFANLNFIGSIDVQDNEEYFQIAGDLLYEVVREGS